MMVRCVIMKCNLSLVLFVGVAAQYENCTLYKSSIGDGNCDWDLNNMNCGYDGGDCCACTCEDGPYWTCGDSPGFACVDLLSCPDEVPEQILPYLNCTYAADIGDGTCDDVNNNPECGYDGGDCCYCTCIGSAFRWFDFNCRDPGAAEVLYNCQETPISAVPCSTDIPREWVVQDTPSAIALAEAVSCSGGTFRVKWKGHVVVTHSIHIENGTTLHLTGDGAQDAVDGAGATPLFTVVSASLHVSTMLISNGHAILGGAIAAVASNVSFNHTSFAGNNATSGGALYIMDNSTVSLTGLINFTDNHADDDGGAVYVGGGSIVSWGGDTVFSRNTVSSFGGAVSVADHSTVFWDAKTLFFNNSANMCGGALSISGGSTVSWRAETRYVHNRVSSGQGGGAVSVHHASVSWDRNTTFSNNLARYSGGAFQLLNATVSWRADTFFMNNSAELGGALHATLNSTVSWDGNTWFLGNSGSALHIESDSTAFWNSRTWFLGNGGSSGGALSARAGATVFWAAQTEFSHNIASSSGGALHLSTPDSLIHYGANNVSWEGDTVFFNNSAEDGSAVFFGSNANIMSCSARTEFRSNSASSNGGAVGSSVADAGDGHSSLLINGTTTFLDNGSGTSGGGIAVLSALSVEFATENVTFRGNSAKVSGGAAFVAGVGIGLKFVGFSFISNSAQQGGAVYATGSGTIVTKTDSLESTRNPTTYDRCEFISNTARATGGAVDSGAGLDVFFNSSFGGNSARVGGALRLAGETSMDNCTFIDNTSDENEGPAVSNIGFISKMWAVTWVGNEFDCESATFLEYNSSGGLFETVCSGCNGNCDNCDYEGDVPLCTGQMEHSTSTGGQITLEKLSITRGYWRATNTSKEVLECYNVDACLGGVTGAPDYCENGYEGPCERGYCGFVRDICGVQVRDGN